MGLRRTHGRIEDLINAIREVENLVAVEREVRTDGPSDRAFEDTGVKLDIETAVADLGICEVGGS